MKDLAFANIKSAGTNSNPNIRAVSATDTSFTSENEPKTTSSSVKSENLQELWKLLDENNNSQIITPHRQDDYDRKAAFLKQQKDKNVNKNEYVIDQQLSARGKKKPIQQGRTMSNANNKEITTTTKPKIRNYNNKNDS